MASTAPSPPRARRQRAERPLRADRDPRAERPLRAHRPLRTDGPLPADRRHRPLRARPPAHAGRPATARPIGRRVDRWDVVAIVAVVVGIALRIRQFLFERDLWLDEAALVRNVLHRGPERLLEPLGAEQAAPVGYLWLLRGVVNLTDGSEAWLRFPSLVAGVCLLPLVWALGRRVLSPRAAAVGVSLVAVSPGLIRYSYEVKQYGLDATVAVAVLLCGVVVDQRRTSAQMAAFAGLGSLAMWLSHPAILVVPGVGALLLLRSLRDRDRRAVGRLVVAGATCAASLAALYLLNLQDARGNEFLKGYWQEGFPDSLLRPDHVLTWLWTNAVRLFDIHGGFGPPSVAVALAAVGMAVALTGRHRRGTLMLLSFAPAMIAAAGLELFPFRGRVAIYALPLLLMALAMLVDRPGRSTLVGGVLVATVATGPLLETARRVVEPIAYPASEAVVDHIAAHRARNEAILLHDWAEPPFDIYAAEHPALRADWRTSWLPADRCENPSGLERLEGRVWVMFAYNPVHEPPTQQDILLSRLDAAAHLVEAFRRYDAVAALYDFDATPDDPTGKDRIVTPAAGCLRLTPA